MSFVEFLKAILVVLWILAGFIIFFKEINEEDDGLIHEYALPSTHTHTHTIIEKTIVSESAKVIPLPPVIEDEQHEEQDQQTNMMKQVVFFSKKIKVNRQFYESLDQPLKDEFKKLFIDQGPDHVVPDLIYHVGQDNEVFFSRLYQDIYDYRKVISLPLMQRLHKEMLSLAPDAQTKTLLNQTAATTTYTRRKDRSFLDFTEALCKDDIDLHKRQLKTKNGYIYSYARLAIMLEKSGRFQEALNVTDEAIKLNLDDRTIGNYAARKGRLLNLLKEKETTHKVPVDQPTKPFISPIKAVPLPVIQASDQDDDGNDNVMKDVVFFKHMIQPNQYFYEKLDPVLQPEFKLLFIDQGKDHLVKELAYSVGKANDPFFNQLFQYIFLYRKVISLPLLKRLTEELISLTKEPESHTLIYQTAARTSYPRRQDKSFLDFCEQCVVNDIGIHQRVFNTKNTYVYSYVRQAIILEKSGRIQEALALVEDALARSLDDRTIGNYPERKIRLLGLLEIENNKNKKGIKEDIEEESEESSVEDEAALENIQIFKTAIKANRDFYDRLSANEKLEFRRYFMEEGPQRLTKDITYVIDGNNDQFFMRVFNYIYRYRKLITLSLLTKIYNELLTFTNDDAETQTIINELAIRVAYFRRKDTTFLESSYQWSKNDVSLHRGILNSFNTYVYSFTRLAIILEKKKLFAEAIELVNEALKRQLNDRTKTGYQGRLIRLNKKVSAVKS
jgi:tetratricopeptide (TPR) repeat protein